MNTVVNETEKIASHFVPLSETTSLLASKTTDFDEKDAVKAMTAEGILTQNRGDVEEMSLSRLSIKSTVREKVGQPRREADGIETLSSLSLNSLAAVNETGFGPFSRGTESKIDKMKNTFSIELESSIPKELNCYTRQYLKWIKTSLSLSSLEQLSKYYSSDCTRTSLTRSDAPTADEDAGAPHLLLPSGEDISTDRATVVTGALQSRRILRSFQLSSALHFQEYLVKEVLS